MTVAKHQVGATIVAIRWVLLSGSIVRAINPWVDVAVKLAIGFAVTEHNHIHGLPDLSLLNQWRGIHITTQTKVQALVQTPIIVTNRKACFLADPVEIKPGCRGHGLRAKPVGIDI